MTLEEMMLIRQSSVETDHVDDSGPGLAQSVREAVDRYFSAMDDQPVRNLYELVLSEIEAPLLEYILSYTENNQSRSAVILGLNRGTLRKKLKKYSLL